MRPWIIKVGGSLDSGGTLAAWLTVIATLSEVVLVPGGGVYADAVRTQQHRHGFDDGTAHAMALLAMDQYGHQLIAMGGGRLQGARDEPAIVAALGQGRIPVWLPSVRADPDPSIERAWTVTSDSLALWLARRLEAAGVVLLKSAAIGEGTMAVSEATRRGWVDDAFARLHPSLSCSVRLLGAGGLPTLAGIVAGGPGGLELR